MAKVVQFEVEIKGIKGTIDDVDSLKAAIKATNTELGGTKFGTQEYKRLQTQLGSLKNVQKQVTDETRKQQREFQRVSSASGSYRQLNAELVQLRGRFKELSAEERKTFGPQLISRIKVLDKELKNLDKTIGNNQRNVGNYASAFNGLANVLGAGILVGGAQSIFQGVADGITDAIGVFADFTNQIAILQAVSGASAEEIAALEENAKELGATTQFAASQVAELQINFARGGFSTDEILAATEATLDLALATGEDLSSASQVVSANVRAFGLEATQTESFVNTLTTTLNRSNQVLSDYSEASKEFAPVARQLGISVEEASAAIGILADNGLRGTAATTTVSTSLLRLTDDSKKYAKAAEDLGVTVFDQNGEFVGLANLLEGVNEATADFTDQQRAAAVSQIFGIQAARNFNILLNAQKEVQTENGKETLAGADALRGFTAELENTGNSAERAAAVIGNTLTGDIKVFESTFEAFQIQFAETFEGLTRGIVQFGASFIRGIGEAFDFLVDAFAPVVDAIRGFISEIFRGAQETTIFQGILNVVAGTIRVVANILGTAIRQVTGLIAGIRSAANSIPFLSRAIEVVKDIVNDAILGISFIPAVVNGAIEAVKGIQRNAIATINSVGLRAKIVAADIQGVFSAEARERAAALRSQLRESQQQGESIGDAFRRGFRDAVRIREEQAEQLKANEAAKAAAKKSGEDIGKDFSDGVSDGARRGGGNAAAEETKTLLEQLTDKQKKLKDQIIEGRLAGRDMTEQLKEYNDITERINKATEDFSNKVKKVEEATVVAEGSIKGLSAEVKELQEQIQNATPEEVEGIAAKLIEAEEKLADAKRNIDELTRTASERAKAELDAEVDRIEQDKQLNLLALQGKELQEKEFIEQRKALEAQANIDILQARLAASEEGSLEQLRIQSELNDALRAQNKQTTDDLAQQYQDALGRVGRAITGIQEFVDGFGEIGELNAERRLNNLEAQYNRDLELAGDNEQAKARIEEDFQARREQIEEEEFKRAKRLQQLSATLSYFQGIINILSAPSVLPQPFSAIYKAARIAFLTASYRAQIANIASQQLGEGGLIEEIKGMKTAARGINIQPLKLNAVQGGRLHSQGGNHTSVYGQPLEYERGEFATMDEFGGVAVINRKNTARFGNILKRIGPKNYAGKRRDLSLINSFGGNGIVFAREGISITPSLTGGLSQTVTVSSGFSDQQIEQLGGVLSAAVRDGAEEGAVRGARQGARQGVSDGLITTTREQERLARLESDIG